MTIIRLKRSFFVFLTALMAVTVIPSAQAEEMAVTADLNVEVTASDVGASEVAVNSATEESSEDTTQTGTLIEIGNTTAEETTIIVRTTDEGGQTEDVTLQVSTDSVLTTDTGTTVDLSDWIAGDQITFTAEEGQNSGELKAKRIRNRSFKALHRGRNGFVTALRPEENEMDVEWNKQIFTLNTEGAKMVAGAKNPASLADFKVGDRIRARVTDDGDKNPATWDAKIIVVLRRGETLFMRVTRWVVPCEITMIPEDTSTFPTSIECEVLPSRFYQEGDVNNLVGAPGTKLTIDITADTLLVRRFLGIALLAEFSEGDHIRVIGRRDEGTGHLSARVIINQSIQKLGVAHHLGKVTAVDTTRKTISVILMHTKRTDVAWTIQLSDTTKIHKAGSEITLDQVMVGDIVRTRGVANRVQKVINASVVNVVTRLVVEAEKGGGTR